MRRSKHLAVTGLTLTDAGNVLKKKKNLPNNVW